MLQKRLKIFVRIFNVFTLVVMFWLFYEFVTKGRTPVPAAMTTLYLTVLAFYVGDKEFQRLKKRYTSRGSRGERFVYLWLFFLIAVSAVVAFGGGKLGYRIPVDLPVITGSVLVLYVITQYLKGRR